MYLNMSKNRYIIICISLSMFVYERTWNLCINSEQKKPEVFYSRWRNINNNIHHFFHCLPIQGRIVQKHLLQSDFLPSNCNVVEAETWTVFNYISLYMACIKSVCVKAKNPQNRNDLPSGIVTLFWVFFLLEKNKTYSSLYTAVYYNWQFFKCFVYLQHIMQPAFFRLDKR